MSWRSPEGLTQYDLGWERIFCFLLNMAYLCSLSEACVSKYWKQELKSFNRCIQTHIGSFSWRLDKSWIHKTKARRNPSEPSAQVYSLEVGAWHMRLSLTTGKQGRKGSIWMCCSSQGINFSGLCLDLRLCSSSPLGVLPEGLPMRTDCRADPGRTLLFPEESLLQSGCLCPWHSNSSHLLSKSNGLSWGT